MSLFVGAVLIFAQLVLGTLFWSVVKADTSINATLADSIIADDLVTALVSSRFFEKTASDASDPTGKASASTGKIWERLLQAGAGYQKVIEIERKSSLRSFRVPRNALFVLSMIVFLIEFEFLPGIYIIVSAAAFLFAGFMPLPESGAKRAFSELGALSWLVYHFYKSDHEECARSLAVSPRLKHLYEAVARLGPKYRHEYQTLGSVDISPAVFRDVYLHMPTKFLGMRDRYEFPNGAQAPGYGAEVEELVAMLVRAGLSSEKYQRRGQLYEPPPPIFWHKAARAANELRAWLRRNPGAPPDSRAAQARKVVDRTGLVPRFLR
jgi:hypothetical protein